MATRESNKTSSTKKESDDKKKVVVKTKEVKTSSKSKTNDKPEPVKKLSSSIDRLVKSIADKVRSYRNSPKEKVQLEEYDDSTSKKLQNKESAKNAGKEKEEAEERGTTKTREEVRRTTPRGGSSFGGSRGKNSGNRGGRKTK